MKKHLEAKRWRLLATGVLMACLLTVAVLAQRLGFVRGIVFIVICAILISLVICAFSEIDPDAENLRDTEEKRPCTM